MLIWIRQKIIFRIFFLFLKEDWSWPPIQDSFFCSYQFGAFIEKSKTQHLSHQNGEHPISCVEWALQRPLHFSSNDEWVTQPLLKLLRHRFLRWYPYFQQDFWGTHSSSWDGLLFTPTGPIFSQIFEMCFWRIQNRIPGSYYLRCGEPVPSKIDAMLAWPTPSSQKSLRGFLGLTGFYRRFIKDYAKLVFPLTSLLRRDWCAGGLWGS